MTDERLAWFQEQFRFWVERKKELMTGIKIADQNLNYYLDLFEQELEQDENDTDHKNRRS